MSRAYNNKIRQELARHPRRESVVHVGCGTGTHTALLSSIADEVVGIDIDPKKTEAAGKLYPNISFYPVDAGGTGFTDGWFDTAFMIMFLHHHCTEEIIREVCRIAGEVVVIDYSRVLYGLMGRIIRLWEKDKYESFSAVNLTRRFAQCGFALKESRSIHPNYFIYFFVRGKAPKKPGRLMLV